MADKYTILNKEFLSRHITVPGNLTQNELFSKAMHDFGMKAHELNQFLWDKYHPSNIWIVVTSIGLLAAFSLWLYDKFLLKSKESGR